MKNVLYFGYIVSIGLIVLSLLNDKNDCESKIVEAAESQMVDVYTGKNQSDQKMNEANKICKKGEIKAGFINKLISF